MPASAIVYVTLRLCVTCGFVCSAVAPGKISSTTSVAAGEDTFLLRDDKPDSSPGDPSPPGDTSKHPQETLSMLSTAQPAATKAAGKPRTQATAAGKPKTKTANVPPSHSAVIAALHDIVVFARRCTPPSLVCEDKESVSNFLVLVPACKCPSHGSRFGCYPCRTHGSCLASWLRLVLMCT